MPSIDFEQRRLRKVEAISADDVDLLVIGGGIVGAGVARDAAMRRLRVGLVEQYDFAFGTSSRTSRLLHGGLRYLAQGRVPLVYEASQEKRILHRIAPHLAQPLAFVFPTYRGTRWPLWQLRVGVKMYDFLCSGHNLGPSSSMTATDVLRRLPEPNPDRLTGGVRYYDGLTNDARLVLDTLRSATAGGAAVLNYSRVVSADPHGSGWKCYVHDTLADRTYTVIAKAVVHAAGPWAPMLPMSSIRLRLTKGVHLVIDRQRLPVPDAVVLTEGPRILFAIPWGERVILGTTDTDYDGPPENVRTEPADVDYILGVVNHGFPNAKLTRLDVVSTWVGLRPLVADARGRPSDISRAHVIRMSQPGWIDVAGGKLTTYRHIAEQSVNEVLRYLGRPQLESGTAALPLLDADQTLGVSGICPPEISPEVVTHYCDHEWALHLDDVMVRRTGWQYYHRDRRSIAEQVAGWMGELLGWGPERREAELTRWEQAGQ